MSIDQLRVSEIIRNADLYDLMRISLQSGSGRLKNIDTFMQATKKETNNFNRGDDFSSDEVARAVQLIET
jgi:hypothetical protein